MKTSELKKFIQIYFKRQRQATFKAQEKEIKMLWRAIKAKIKKDKEKKGIKKLPAKKDKKLEYDDEE
jgi:hypothetical protein